MGTTGADALPRDLLERAYASGRRAWPDVSLSADVFAAFLAGRLDGSDPALSGTLSTDDLYLVCATLRRDPAALAAFESRVLSRVGQYVGRLDASPQFVAEVAQNLRVKLFLGEGGADGKLAHYSGRGSLHSWVCAVALRAAHDLLRGRPRAASVAPPQELDVLAASDDVELQLLRARHHQDFRRAVEEAMTALAPRDRTMLRLYFLEKVTAIQLGRMYGVHETTALRWLARAQEFVAARVRSDLEDRLRLRAEELDELMVLFRSRLDLTFGKLLATQQG